MTSNRAPHKDALCGVCLGGFSAQSWEDRHTTPDGEDCHERCCPDPPCRADRREARAARKAAKEQQTTELSATDFAKLISDAARATEIFGEDELERFTQELEAGLEALRRKDVQSD